ncbi:MULTISPECIES: PadR family transcriptional regulator [Micromonospora]|uniref:PadR family transcriptional regulator n=1 Tax=Micromonospora solifontis TaxID=2487138 RepID=A0ABX9WHP3_9ACTN|nr:MULTISPECIES: PadR family transcriptional regulator [Micromonospora]NES12442.1 PadR family transcriptional regulator [Micromonospora sp. PPF5-17B]NES36358.1 PadR family transcriptional regulator [Micromonospora solifontis]NES57796.1 PadR family transcriptional regulator [Micromonospora sp. PPF5-6]RNL99599.1 PadR family transcriptional regulator [Micromonospora solifontis]
MPGRRKVGNLTALAVLAVLVERPMHPYELATTLRGRGKDQDMGIKWGSFYTVVRNMERHGLIAAVQSVREGRRPERTVYRITDDGRAELVDWARELVATPTVERSSFRAGLSVLAVLHPDEATALLRDRLAQLEEAVRRERAAYAEHARQVPRLFLVENEYDLTIQEAEAAWIRALLAEITSGSYPGLDEWRAYHTAGPPAPGPAGGGGTTT